MLCLVGTRQGTGSSHCALAIYAVFTVKLILLPYHHSLIILALLFQSAVPCSSCQWQGIVEARQLAESQSASWFHTCKLESCFSFAKEGSAVGHSVLLLLLWQSMRILTFWAWSPPSKNDWKHKGTGPCPVLLWTFLFMIYHWTIQSCHLHPHSSLSRTALKD